MLTKKEKHLLNLLEGPASANDIEIVTVEVIGSSKSPVIRVYIDCEGGIDVDGLIEAQSWIGSIMDEDDPFPGAYTLEVSSPGIDRPLRTLEHFKRVVGETIKLRTLNPIEGRSNFKGTLVKVEDDTVVLEVDNDTFSVPLSSIKRANLVGKVDFK